MRETIGVLSHTKITFVSKFCFKKFFSNNDKECISLMKPKTNPCMYSGTKLYTH